MMGLFLALAIAFVVIWLSYKPDVRSLATEQMVEAGADRIPAPSPALSAPTVVTPAEPSVEARAPEQEKPEDSGDSDGAGAEKKEKPEAGGGGGGGGEGQAEVEAEKVELVGDFIVGVSSGRCVTVPLKKGKAQDGTGLELRDCDDEAPNQRWSFQGDGTVRSMEMCMDVAWGSTEDGAQIQLARCSGNPAQTIARSPDRDLVNPQADKCVDADEHGTANGTKLLLWTCTGLDNQKWLVRTV
ncbi:ricin-type beta-trefoil lectin domain protein, partial [Streptomyces sp. NPDC005774]|uniref:ricin-type beta-trefoil lectin domain protein n=1 Tax=Streptomyces sp. NPDC005774 TaxID=3364728 RepID=UPI0036CB7CC3